tara:strand:+ start:26 stop:1237 length:1212 start_codon:yes stop_codon:yes gene_type:complete
MFSKRTRLFIHFNLINFFQIIKSLVFKKKNFQNSLQKFLNKDNLSLTSLGRSALYDIVKIIISTSKKRIFFIAPYTIPAVIHAIIYAGGKIVYIDLNKSTGLIDENKLDQEINEDTAGVIITHLYSDNQSIKNFINRFKNKITIIEDAAINFGAKTDNKFLGTLGHYGFFSFAMVKNLNTFNGGALFIEDKQIYLDYISNKKSQKYPFIKTLSLLITAIIIKTFFNNFSYQISHFFLKIIYKKKIKIVLKKIYPVLFHKLESKTPDIYFSDFNWIMNDVGNYNLKKVETGIQKRLQKAKIYFSLINEDVATKTNCFEGENAMLEYPIILKHKNNIQAHQELMRQGYDVRHTWYINNINEKKSPNKDKFKDSCFIEERILCLPLHDNINEKDISKISKIINTLK